MSKIRIAVLCPSEIAIRRFMPALMQVPNIEYVGVGCIEVNEIDAVDESKKESFKNRDFERCLEFQKQYGGKIFSGYNELIQSTEVDAIYVPLPPSLHYKWGIKVLGNNKHLFLEKPSTIKYNHTKKLIKYAKSKNLAVHENYMFIFHSQIKYIEDIIVTKQIGDVRLIRLSFGFPFRGNNDFRYNKDLGGGALLDCGGYTIKLARKFLGSDINVSSVNFGYLNEFDVDIYGSATLTNKRGLTSQISFGMDNSYKCELEIWGSKGLIKNNRIFTAPSDLKPEIDITINGENKKEVLQEDNSFLNSIIYFTKCIVDETTRKNNYIEILEQSRIVEKLKRRLK